MPRQLNADATRDLSATIQFNVDGDNGGRWYFTIDDGKGWVTKGTAPSADLTISIAANDFVDMTTGKLNGKDAFSTGKMKLSGDRALAIRMETFFQRSAPSGSDGPNRASQ